MTQQQVTLNEQPKPDERFIETVSIGNQVMLHHEGTIGELNALTQPSSMPRLRTAGTLSNADTVIDVAKFVWDIIKDSNAKTETDGACTRVLSVKDNNWVDYENAEDFTSDEVIYKLDNFAGVNCYTIAFRVVGTYRARHRTIGGQWMPVVYVTFSRCDATWPWVINGTATIDTDNVSNMRTKEDPLPQIVLVIKFTTNAQFAFSWESHERSVALTLNAQDGVKLVPGQK